MAGRSVIEFRPNIGNRRDLSREEWRELHRSARIATQRLQLANDFMDIYDQAFQECMMTGRSVIRITPDSIGRVYGG